jgi:hypothetical protein
MSNYINIFHTVPLDGQEMIRDAEGKKIGITFPKGGWTQYVTTKNTSNTPVLAAIALTDFIGLDFDTDESFNLALQIDSECKYVAKSDYKGGHLLYRCLDDLGQPYTKLTNSKVPGLLDIQMGNSLIYLATPANKTKTLLTDPINNLSDLTMMPLAMQMYVENLLLRYQNDNIVFQTSNNSFHISEDSTLGYLLKDIKPQDGYNIDIFKILTPKKYRPNKLHPNDIPDGEGTEYLQAIRTRLALDISISEQVLRNTMHYINNQWDSPMPASRIESDCTYQIQKATIDGNKAWVYNEDWDKQGLIVKDKYLSAVEFMFESNASRFVEFNRTTQDIIVHSSISNAKNSLVSKKRTNISTNDMITKAVEVDIVSDPTLPSYFIQGKRPYKPQFNLFVPALGTQILRNPELVNNPRYPTNILKFLENLIPNKNRRDWIMRFVKYKHTHYEYSPIYIVFAGVGGAGKGVFINEILTFFAGLSRIQDIDIDKLQNNFNAWKATTDYAHLDEAGEGMSKKESSMLVAELKKLTGSPTVSIQFKGKDISGKDTVRHFITPILNTNMTVKVITDLPKNDRRFVFVKCPNKMTKVSNNNDAMFVQLIRDELPHFAHYLATQVEELDKRDYNSNESQKDKDYLEFMDQTMDPYHLLLDAAEERDVDKFVRVLSEEFFVSSKLLDRLFDSRIQVGRTSNNPGARIVMYNTPNLSPSGIYSLYDLADDIDALEGNHLKKLLSHLKMTSTFCGDRGEIYKYHYVGFNGDYKPSTSIDSVDDGKDIEIN